MSVFFLLFLVAPIFALVLWAGKRQTEERNRAYTHLSNKLGLELRAATAFGYPGLVGHYRGEPVEVGVELRGGKNKSPFTWVSCDMSGFPLDISLYPQGFLQGVARMFGMMDIEVDDPVFDDAVVVQGDDIPGLRRVLASRAVRQELVSVFGEYRLATVRGGQVRIVKRGFTDNLAELAYDLDRLVSLAKLLQGGERMISDVGGDLADLGLPDDLAPAVRQALLEQRQAERQPSWLESMTSEPEPQVLHVDEELRPVEGQPEGAEAYQDVLGSLRERAEELEQVSAAASPPAVDQVGSELAEGSGGSLDAPVTGDSVAHEEAAPDAAALAARFGLTPDPAVQPPSLHVDEVGQRLPVEAPANPFVAPPVEAPPVAAPSPWPSGGASQVDPPTTPTPSASRKISLSDLEPLAKRGLSGRDLDAALEPILGAELSVSDVEVREVRRSSSFGVAERYRGGSSVVVKLESGVELSFLLTKDDPRAQGLKRGSRFSGSGVTKEWERLYRRVVVEG